MVARSEVKKGRRLGDSDFEAYHAYMNPSSRRTGAQEFDILVGSLQDGSLWRACEEIAGKFQGKTSYTAVSGAMREHGVILWQHGAYNCVRLVRWLLQAEGVEVDWSEVDWSILCGMGEGVRRGMKMCGLSTYADACRLCKLISSATGEPYAMDSLACLLCLGSRNSSRRFNEVKWPEPARPVTIADDLEIDAAPLVTSQPLARYPEMSQKPCIATKQSSDRLLCMKSIIMCLDIKSHFALRQCGRSTCLSGRVPLPLARDEQLHYWVARFLHVDGPHAVELQRHGISKGCLTRALACAWDWLEVLERTVLHSLWRDPFLGALVVVRLATKFEVPDAHLAEALRLYRSAKRQKQIVALEISVVQVLPAWRMQGGK